MDIVTNKVKAHTDTQFAYSEGKTDAPEEVITKKVKAHSGQDFAYAEDKGGLQEVVTKKVKTK